MPDNSYIVVFEYDETMGGAYGVRTWTSYVNQAEFEKIHTSKGHPGNVVVAQGVTQDEALDLTSLTPEICRLMCAVEQAFQGEIPPPKEIISFYTTNAKFAIVADRQRISDRHLVRHNANKYIQAARQLLANKPTLRTATIQVIMLFCLNQQGQISLDLRDFTFPLS